METSSLPLYVAHPGTVKVAGSTVPRKAAFCAMAFLEEKRPNVEFLFIGAAAGQQALKAVGILSEIFDSKWEASYALVFRPMRFRTIIETPNQPLLGKLLNPNPASREVDAQVWRATVLDLQLINNASQGIR